MKRALVVVAAGWALALAAPPSCRATGCGGPGEPRCGGDTPVPGAGAGGSQLQPASQSGGSGGMTTRGAGGLGVSGGGGGGIGLGPTSMCTGGFTNGVCNGTGGGIGGGGAGYNGGGIYNPNAGAGGGPSGFNNQPDPNLIPGVSGGGSGAASTPPSSSKPGGPQMGAAVAANPNWSQADIAKLQGPVTQSQEVDAPVSGQPSAPPPSAAALAAAAAMRAAQKPAPAPDFLGKTVTSLGGLPAEATNEQKAADFVHSAGNELKLGDNADALRDALQAIQLDPNNPAGYLRASEAYNHMGQFADAERMARSAIEKDPNNPQAWKNFAWALLKQGKYKEALEAALQAAKLKPDMAEAWAIAAFASERLNDLGARNDDLAKAAAIDPRFKDKLSDALKGNKIYTDDDTDSVVGDAAPKAGGSSLPLAAGGAAAGAAVVGAAVWLWLRRRRAAEAAANTVVQLEPVVQPAARAPQMMASSGGAVIGKYELGSLIGRGGMGEVYIAKDLSLGRAVAIKKMTDGFSELGAQARALFLKEARTVAQLHHPAIVDIYEILEHPNGLYLVFEFVKGKTAQQALAEAGRLPLGAVTQILKPVCEALDFAHGRALVHRDLKPGNIMLTEQGHVKLMDFGIARSLGDAVQTSFGAKTAAPAAALSSARTATVVGTPSYMAPESELGVVCKEGDVYSLGVTLYEMLTGRLPFSAANMAAEKAALSFPKASTLAPGVPAAVDALISDALQPLVERRLKTPGEFLARLAAAGG